MNALSFGSPIFLAVAALTLPLAWWAMRPGLHRRREALARFGEESLLAKSSDLPGSRAQLASIGLRFGAVALGLIALARPQLGEQPASLAHTGRDVLVLLDLSRSMNVADGGLAPSETSGSTRLAVAKRAIADVLAASPENRVGLIVFGGSAFLQLPLTGNQATFQSFLGAASTDDLGDPATDLGGALAAAAIAFEHDGQRGYQSLLLVSDGESGGDTGPALTRLRRAGIPVFAIGVGSPDGAPVPADSSEMPEKWHRDHIGRVVVSRLEENDLRRAARETNGVYARWTPDAGQSLGTELARMEKRTLSSRESTERVDRFQWPLALALAALGLQPMIGLTRRRKRT
jgi:Ca-activated chloride channel family protein